MYVYLQHLCTKLYAQGLLQRHGLLIILVKNGAVISSCSINLESGQLALGSKNLNKAAEEEIRSRLCSIELEGGGVVIKVASVLKLSVEAALHVRRGKRVPTFDISFTARWEGWKAGEPRPATTPSGKQAAGEVTVTDIMQDDVDSDFTVNVYMSSVSGHNAIDLRSKDVAKVGLPLAVRAQLRAFSGKLKQLAIDADAAAAEKAKREEEAKKAVEANADAAAIAERQRLAAEQAARLQQTAAAITAHVTAVKEKAAEQQAAAQAAAAVPAPQPAADALTLPVPQKVEAAGAAPEVKASEWNQGAWAWETRDLSGWAHARLTELLSHVELDVPPVVSAPGRPSEPGAFIKTIKPDSLKVDASVSLRKGRKLVIFEVTAEVPWEGTLVGADGAVIGNGDGMMKILDLDQDSVHDGAYTCSCAPDEEGGQVDALLADKMQAHAVPMIKKRLVTFAQELASEAEKPKDTSKGGK